MFDKSRPTSYPILYYLNSISDYSQPPYNTNLNSFTHALKSMYDYYQTPSYPNINSLTHALKPMSNYSWPPYYPNLYSLTPSLKPMLDNSRPTYYPNLNSLSPALKYMSNYSRLPLYPTWQINQLATSNWLTHKQHNKLVHALNGNRRSKGLKFAHWNLGSAFLQNKLCEIEAAVAHIKPSILGISESNLRSNTDLNTVQIPGYQLLTAKTLQNPNIQMSRVVVYLSNDISGSLREDLMDDDFSSIWVELSTSKNNKKTLVSNMYRDHQ